MRIPCLSRDLQHAVDVRVISQRLDVQNSAKTLYDEVSRFSGPDGRAIAIDILVNNA